MALDSPSSSAPPCQGTLQFCPNCGSTTLTKEPKKADLFTGDCEPRRIISDSDAFSRVLMVAIGRMSMIAEETMREKKMLTKDVDAMVGILENVCLMKSTISYLLHEMHGGVNDADASCSSSEAEDLASPSTKDGPLSREEEEEEEDGNDCEPLFRRTRRRAFDSCRDNESTECDYLSRNDGNGVNDDDGGGNGSAVVIGEDGIKEKERAVLTISRGLIGGIATMSIIAKDASEAKKVLLADDKEALAEMLNIVQMVKLLI